MPQTALARATHGAEGGDVPVAGQAIHHNLLRAMNRAFPMREDDRGRTPQELADAARREKERLAPLVAERAKKYEGLKLEHSYARWAEVMESRVEWASLDDFKV